MNYKIEDLQDLSHIGAKRYSATVVLVNKFSKERIKEIINEVTKELRSSNYYRTKIVKKFWKKRKAQVVWLTVIIQHQEPASRLCETLWIDPKLSKDMRPLSLKGNDKVGEIEILWIDGAMKWSGE